MTQFSFMEGEMSLRKPPPDGEPLFELDGEASGEIFGETLGETAGETAGERSAAAAVVSVTGEKV